jgi:hypothetical protein
VLLELYCLEEEEEGFDIPILTVQAPIYRRGPGYSLWSGCPAAGFPVDAVLAWVPPSSGPLPGHRLLYKAPFPLDWHIRGIALGLPRVLSWGRGLLGVVVGAQAWLASCWSLASVALVGTLLPLIKSLLKVFVIFAGSCLQW